jgi:hypothetical protein
MLHSLLEHSMCFIYVCMCFHVNEQQIRSSCPQNYLRITAGGMWLYSLWCWSRNFVASYSLCYSAWCLYAVLKVRLAVWLICSILFWIKWESDSVRFLYLFTSRHANVRKVTCSVGPAEISADVQPTTVQLGAGWISTWDQWRRIFFGNIPRKQSKNLGRSCYVVVYYDYGNDKRKKLLAIKKQEKNWCFYFWYYVVFIINIMWIKVTDQLRVRTEQLL